MVEKAIKEVTAKLERENKQAKKKIHQAMYSTEQKHN